MRRTLEEPQINLTPLIDVVFVILILFIVVAPLLELDRVELAPGPPLDNEQTFTIQESSPITIHVLANDALTFNNQPVTMEQLKTHLQMAHARFPEKNPQLFHDRNARFGTYQLVKNAVEGAGFKELDVILKPE